MTHWKSIRRMAVLGLTYVAFIAPHAGAAERHLLYVAAPGIRNYLEFGGAGILVFDMDKDYAFVKRIETPASQTAKPENIKGVCANAVTKRLYFTTLTKLYCVDLVTEKTLWGKPLSGGCDRMAMTPDGKFLYVPSLERAHWNIVDGETGDAVAQIETKSGSHNTVCSLDGTRAYLAGLRSPLLTVVDTRTHQKLTPVGPFSAAIRPFTVNGANTRCYVNVNGLLGFEVGDLTTGKLLHRVEVQGFSKGPIKRHGCPSHGVGLTPDEKEVWVCDAANQRLHVFDNTVMPPKQMASVKLREEPGWVTFTLDGKQALSSTGEVIDAETKKIICALQDEKGREVHSEKMVEIVFEGGIPVRTGDQFGLGRRPRVAANFAGRASADDGGKLWVFIGTYTNRGSKGIYRCELDLATGKLSEPMLAAETKNPSFLAIHPSRKFLYAVGEYADPAGKRGGGISAFSLDPRTGALTLLNQASSVGAGPCHLVVDKEGKHVLAANYGGGSTVSLPIEEDGRLGARVSFVQHKGSSVNKQRQESPHAHSVNLDAGNRFAFVADLGLDKVLIYRFDPKTGAIVPNDKSPAADVAAGAGPRHFAFHPNGKYAYAINELNNTVTAFSYDAENGVLKEQQAISTLPPDFKGTSYCAEVVCHPSGKFLYGSNRGHNSIAIFGIDDAGKLTALGHQASGIKTPRNFNIDPTGKYLLVANQDADTVIVFRVNQQTGELSPTGSTVSVAMPVCLKFVSIME